MSEFKMTPTEAASAVDAWRNDGDPHTPWPDDALRALIDNAHASANGFREVAGAVPVESLIDVLGDLTYDGLLSEAEVRRVGGIAATLGATPVAVPEVVTGTAANDLPVGSIVVRDYSEHDYESLGHAVPTVRFPVTRTKQGWRTHERDGLPDALARNFRFSVLYRAAAARRPLAVGDTVTTVEELNRAPIGTTFRDAGGRLVDRTGPDTWLLYLHEGARYQKPSLPARVLDLPEVAS